MDVHSTNDTPSTTADGSPTDAPGAGLVYTGVGPGFRRDLQKNAAAVAIAISTENVAPRQPKEIDPHSSPTAKLASLASGDDVAGYLTFSGRMESYTIQELLSGKPRDDIQSILLRHGAKPELARYASLPTKELLSELDTLSPGSEEHRTLSTHLALRWFGNRDSTNPYPSAESPLNRFTDPDQIDAIVGIVRAAADPQAPISQIHRGFGKAFITSDFSFGDWDATMRYRSSPFPRSAEDAEIVKRIEHARVVRPEAMVSAMLADFKGQFVGEPKDGKFMMSVEAIDTMPHLVDKILERPGTEVFAFGKQTDRFLSYLEKHNHTDTRITWIEGDKEYNNWATDYQGLRVQPLNDPSGKPILLDPFYAYDRANEDAFPKMQGSYFGLQTRSFPLHLEVGNFLSVAPGVTATSERTLENIGKTIGFAGVNLQSLLEQCLGPLIVVPYTDRETGHVDMDVTPIQTRNGPAVLVPEVDLEGHLGVAVIKSMRDSIVHATSSRSPKLKEEVAEFVSSVQARERSIRQKGATLDAIATKLEPHVEVIRVPSIPYGHLGEEQGTSTMANSLFFTDAAGKSNLIVPEYPAAPLSEEVKEAYRKRLSPHIDNISFLSVISPTTGENLATLSGVFHCIAPQVAAPELGISR
jgi:hypothetical protein